MDRKMNPNTAMRSHSSTQRADRSPVMSAAMA